MYYTKQQIKQYLSDIKAEGSVNAIKNIEDRLRQSKEVSYFEIKYFVYVFIEIELTIIRAPIAKVIEGLLYFNNNLIKEYLFSCIIAPANQYNKIVKPFFDFKEINTSYFNNILDKVRKEWENVIKIGNKHCDKITQKISIESNQALENLKKLPTFNEYGFFRECFRYQGKRNGFLDYSHYCYFLVKDVFEEETSNFIITFNHQEIYYDVDSLIHILIGHYGDMLNAYQDDIAYPIIKFGKFETKSIHKNREFVPQNLFYILSDVFEEIEKSKIINNIIVNKKTYKITLRYIPANIIYQIWIKERYVNGNKSKPFLHIESFYPVESLNDISSIKLLNEINISPQINIFI